MKYVKRVLPLVILFLGGLAKNAVARKYSIINMTNKMLEFSFTGSPQDTILMSAGSKKELSNASCIATDFYSIPVKIVDKKLFNELKAICYSYIEGYDPRDKMYSWQVAYNQFQSAIKKIATAPTKKEDICGDREVIFGKYKDKTYAILSD